jgi:ankyrin repeat and BTB/POZ domain-containing protein 2
MEYCQGFLLQNMVALLTYDDSVKRLLFAKKIPNHDVLSGLLTTLQQRIKARRNTPSQNAVKTSPMIAKASHNNSTSNNINSKSNGLNKSSNNLTE